MRHSTWQCQLWWMLWIAPSAIFPLYLQRAFSYCGGGKSKRHIFQTALCPEATWVPAFRFAHWEAEASSFGSSLWTSKVKATQGFMGLCSQLPGCQGALSWERWPEPSHGLLDVQWLWLLCGSADAHGRAFINTPWAGGSHRQGLNLFHLLTNAFNQFRSTS